MKFSVNDKILGFLFETKEEETNIKNFFTYNDDSEAFRGGVYDKRKIKKVCLLHKKGEHYYTDAGFLQEMIFFCKKNNISITGFSDKRTKFKFQQREIEEEKFADYFPFDYSEHQERALKKLVKSNVGIIKAPTSAGKTSLFIALLKEINVPTIVLFNKVLLVTQSYDRAVESGIKDVGYAHGGGFKKGKVMFCTIGSVYKVKNFSEYQCLIVDECHRAQANEYQKFLEEYSFPLRFGFSATPEGNRNKYKYALIRRFFGSIIEEISTTELLDNGVIARPIIKFIPVECPKTLDYPSAYERGILYNDIRNKKIAQIYKEEPDVPTLILVKLIEHGDLLNGEIPDSYFVNGSHSVQERNDAIKKFVKGDIKCLIASNIFNEGVSINCIRKLIIASGGLSDVEVIQKIGRALRIDEGKKEALVYDFEDIGNKFLEKHSQHRAGIYKKLGFEII